MDIRAAFRITAGVDGQASVDKLGTSVDNLNRQVSRVPGGSKKAASALQDIRTAATAAGKATLAFAAAYGSIQSAAALGRVADTYTSIQSLLAQITEGESARLELSGKVFAIAQQTGNSFEAQAKLVSRISVAAGELGVSQQQVLDVSRLIAQTFVIAGASSEEASSSATQFAQALGSGVLQGDELKSILENNAVLARAIADGLGVGVGKLRQMGADGDLLARDVLAAILSQAEKIDEKFGKSFSLLSQGATRLENSATNFVGALDQALSASQGIAAAMSVVSQVMDRLAAGVRSNPNGIRDSVVGGLGGIPGQVLLRVLDGQAALERSSERAALQNDATRAEIESFLSGSGFGAPGSFLRDSPLLGNARPVVNTYTAAELKALAAFKPGADGRQSGLSTGDVDNSAFPGSDAIRAAIDSERYYADLQQAVDGYTKEAEESLTSLLESVTSSVAETSGATVDAALEEFAALEDAADTAAIRIADVFEEGLFAVFTEGADGMVDVFNRALAEMVLEAGNSALRETLRDLFTDALGQSQGSGGSGFGGLLASVIGAFAGGGKTGSASVSKNATGGSFIVPGPAAGDRVVPIFRANGGERVTISPAGRAGGGTGVVINQTNDFRGADPNSEARMLAALKANNAVIKREISDLAHRRRL